MVSAKIFHLLALAFLCSVVTAQEHDNLRRTQAVQLPAGTQPYIVADQTTEQTKLTNARNTWNTRGFSNYQYQFSQACPQCYTGNYPWGVMLTPGSPAQAINNKGQAAAGALSIAQMFDKLQAHLDNPNDLIEAYYDANNGYPTRYSIQLGNDQLSIVSSTVSNFESVAGSQQDLYTANRQLWNSKRITNYDYQYQENGPNPNNIMWPLYVKVRNGSPVETKDDNGNIVNYLIPLSFDQQFDLIERQLAANAMMNNKYDQFKGYANDIYILAETTTFQTIFFNYKDTGLS